MEEKKQGLLGTYKCLALFVVMMVVAILIVVVKPMITGEKKYTGVGNSSIGGEVKVEVRIAKGEITAVHVLSHQETEGIGTNAIDVIPGAIVKRQNIDVDVVAGATYTSQAICEAVADAMTQAGLTPAEIPQPETQAPVESGEFGALSAGTYTAAAQGFHGEVTLTITVDDTGVITEAVIDAPDETPELGGAAAAKMQEAILANQGKDIDVVSGATYTGNAVLTALNDCLTQASGNGGSASLGEGTAYTASAQGFHGQVTVTVTIDDAGTITGVQIDAPDETPELGGAAAEKLTGVILEAQSAEIDIVSGASMTSNAVIAALKDCLAQAGK